MKKKFLRCAGIIGVLVLVVLGVCRYIEVRNRQNEFGETPMTETNSLV